MTLEPGVRLSGHLLSEEIGAGGFARVFRASPEGGGPDVAIKVAVRPELVEALRAEGKVLRRLEGPRFVKILEEHLEADPPFVVLELCPGGDLRAALQRGRLSPERALALANGILEGVAFAHDEGLVHGDLKPENVLLDAAGEPKIADLGLSRARRTELLHRRSRVEASLATEDGKVRGTFDYLAPEVRNGEPISPASDVFALGVLLYELLTGTRPYGLFRLPGELVPGVPRALDRVIGRALAHEPRDRYPDAGVMLLDLLAGDAGIAAAVAERPRPEAGVNPLLLSLHRESFLDRLVLPVWLATFYGAIPAIVFLSIGYWAVALAIAAGAIAVTALLVVPSWLVHRLEVWWTMRRIVRALEERGS